MQALDWLFEKDCFEAIDHVGLAHDLESLITNISVHHLSMLQLQTCIYLISYHVSNSCLISNMLHAL